MNSLSLSHITKKYGETSCITDISFELENGETLAILGPSGCGKTTILKMIAGLIEPTSGEIYINGKLANGVLAEKRNVSLVFQKPLLFPHMDVMQNVGFGLQMRNIPRAQRNSSVLKMLDLVKLSGYGKRKVHELSGGQEQRVSLARGLVYQPDILLLDEPFSALDKDLRMQMCELVKTLKSELGLTIILVTHDHEEAELLADKIIFLQTKAQ